jgi:hypothetical protein
MARIRRRAARWVWLASLGLCLCGCYHYRLSPVGPNGVRLPLATEPEDETVWSFFWGISQPEVRPHTCQGNGLAEVTATTNLGFSLLTVVTLGIVAPAQLQWRCAKDVPAQGNDF